MQVFGFVQPGTSGERLTNASRDKLAAWSDFCGDIGCDLKTFQAFLNYACDGAGRHWNLLFRALGHTKPNFRNQSPGLAA